MKRISKLIASALVAALLFSISGPEISQAWAQNAARAAADVGSTIKGGIVIQLQAGSIIGGQLAPAVGLGASSLNLNRSTTGIDVSRQPASLIQTGERVGIRTSNVAPTVLGDNVTTPTQTIAATKDTSGAPLVVGKTAGLMRDMSSRAKTEKTGDGQSLTDAVMQGRHDFDQASQRGIGSTVWAAMSNQRGSFSVSGLFKRPFQTPTKTEEPKGIKGSVGMAVDVVAIPTIGYQLYNHLDKVAIAVGALMLGAFAFLPVNFAVLFTAWPGFTVSALATGLHWTASGLTAASTSLLHWSALTYVYQWVLAMPGYAAGFAAPIMAAIAGPVATFGHFLTNLAPKLVSWNSMVAWFAAHGMPLISLGIGALAITPIPYLGNIADSAKQAYAASGSRAYGFVIGGLVALMSPLLFVRDVYNKILSVEMIKRIAKTVKKFAVRVYNNILAPVGRTIAGAVTGYAAGAVITPVLAMSGLGLFAASNVARTGAGIPRTWTSIAVGAIALAIGAFYLPSIFAWVMSVAPLAWHSVQGVWMATATATALVSLAVASYYTAKDGFVKGIGNARNHGTIRWAEDFLKAGWKSFKQPAETNGNAKS